MAIQAWLLIASAALHHLQQVEGEEHGEVHWYPYSAETWGTLNSVCEHGEEQSPIDFPVCPEWSYRPPPTISWTVLDYDLTNNGHTVSFGRSRPDEVPGSMSFETAGLTASYTLSQCHFHAGSEHTVGGIQAPLEAHCVHTSDAEDGRYGVFGLFFQVGSSSNALVERLSVLGLPGQEAAPVPVPALDPRKLYEGVDLYHFYSYRGSFTTPPCTEGVDFYIFAERPQIAAAQLEAFKVAIGWQSVGGNFRPPQPLFERTIYGCTSLPASPAAWYPYDSEEWGGVCASGSRQSPIDFPRCAESEEQTALEVTWATQAVTLLNTGHNVELKPHDEAPGKLKASGGRVYTLVQCHFHWASEHRVGGSMFPLEGHCVHVKDEEAAGQTYGVFGVLFQVGEASNSYLASFVDHLPSRTAEHHGRRLVGDAFEGPVDLKGIYGDDALTRFWSYSGSLTTPPCTEAVDWYVLMTPATLSFEQLEKFRTKIGWIPEGGTFRPPQALHSRVVGGCARAVGDEYLEAEVLKLRIRLAKVSATLTKLRETESDEAPLEDAEVTISYLRDSSLCILVVLAVIRYFFFMPESPPEHSRQPEIVVCEQEMVARQSSSVMV